MTLSNEIERLLALPTDQARQEGLAVTREFREGLSAGDFRVAEPAGDDWRVNVWVKRGILLAFKIGVVEDRSIPPEFGFFDMDTLPAKPLTVANGVRVAPGGSSIRDGAYIAPNVICMPPTFINIGAYVDEGTMIDSHVLVGACAQIGRHVHLSSAVQIAGVLEPAIALPAIIEDEVFIGGNCGVYEGVLVGKRAVLAPGVLLTGATPVYDLVRDAVYRRTPDAPLTIPHGAVVVPGSRPANGPFAETQGIQLYTPVIVRYRDEKTDASAALAAVLR
ncbi:MAG TPA: 2,3,4,5-tetrahydropyridine-2,6-dicarboxylate N-succinyltransferase [Terriglobia bacterium]|nr:2,3,4,5-tetrahydropyridine-2,6-dicarboxylate N-succinyltransferase [Terriglobia bacterium]